MKMSKLTKTLILLALLAMGTAFALDRYIVHRFNRVDFDPVRKRIDVESGFELTESFAVDYASDYEVGIECKRALPHDQLNGLLQSHLNLTYTVFENETPLVRVDSRNLVEGGAYTDDGITRLLGNFPASPGKNYRIDLLVRSSIPELAATEPTLLVVLDHIVWKTEFAVPAIPFAFARLASGGLGLIIVVCAALSQRDHWIRKQRNTEQATPPYSEPAARSPQR